MHYKAEIQQAKFEQSKRLNLSCNLTEFPEEIYELADSLEILDLSHNQLSSLPDDLPRLHKLRVIFCSNNQFTRLPEVLGRCTRLTMTGFKSNQIREVPASALGVSLRWLILTDNQIEALPASIGLCHSMQKLMLSGNRLTQLPDALAECSHLELLRIAANRLESLPDFLFELPKLSWLAFAGNPCTEQAEKLAASRYPIAEIDWASISPRQQLGEGASGFIHQALWQPPASSPSEVAVKIFKGQMTSDGLPHLEKTACIAAGTHRNLIEVHGKISNHPAEATGLVMSLVKPEYTNLAAPPSLDSCTRDIYPAHSNFTLDTIIKLALAIATVAQHLHERGIMHGDLYAHNILYNSDGDCLLGDFGAASLSLQTDTAIAEKLQRLEVRAWGILLEELLQRCNSPASPTIHSALQTLQQQCMHEKPQLRPLFSDIVQQMQNLQSRQP